MYDRRYAGTNLRSGNYGRNKPEQYIPDFVKLAESYNAVGLRVFNENELLTAFEAAQKEEKRPVVIECVIDSEEIVLPMVKAGCSLNEMILGDEL